MTDRLLLIDFDRTLFDSGRFIAAWWSWLGQRYGLSAEQELSRIDDFYSYVGDWRNYDFMSHLASLQLPTTVEQVMTDGRQALTGQDFLYSDARRLLARVADREVRIVTFGNAAYQRYKLSFCGDLDHLPVDIIEEDKADYVTRRYGDRSVVLIDDKLLDGLPSSIHFVHLDRSQARPIQHHGGHDSVNGLDQLESLL